MARVAASHSNRVHLVEEVKRIEQQIEQLVDRIVSASSQTIIAAYENRLSSLEARKAEVAEMIENCGRPLVDFDTTHRTALGFLENPYLTWAYGSFERKRAVLRLAFPAQLPYQRNHGFRTAETAIPFRIFNDLEDLESEDSVMVPLAGLEPAHLSILDFESSASTNFTTGALRR
jgi:site-specific DNA recombinase